MLLLHWVWALVRRQLEACTQKNAIHLTYFGVYKK